MTYPSTDEWVSLLNDPDVLLHMPLHSGPMEADACAEWARCKAGIWNSPADMGPWSIYVDGDFAGWGGLQPEQDNEAGIAVVLHKRYWGNGLPIARMLIDRYRNAGGNCPIVVLLAKSRNAVGAMQRFGLEYVGNVDEGGQTFDKFLMP